MRAKLILSLKDFMMMRKSFEDLWIRSEEDGKEYKLEYMGRLDAKEGRAKLMVNGRIVAEHDLDYFLNSPMEGEADGEDNSTQQHDHDRRKRESH